VTTNTLTNSLHQNSNILQPSLPKSTEESLPIRSSESKDFSPQKGKKPAKKQKKVQKGI